MDNYGAGGIGAFIVAVIGIIYTAINHKRSRCNLCGKKIEVSVDVGPITPDKTTETSS